MWLQKPVVLLNTNLVTSALHWDLPYLCENLGDGSYSVYESDNHLFKYYDEKKINSHKDFKPTITRKEMKFQDFSEKLKNSESSKKR